MGKTAHGPSGSRAGRRGTLPRAFRVAAVLVAVGSLGLADSAFAGLPDGRSYELVTPVEKNGVNPISVAPALSGEAVDFQASGAFGAATSGSLSLYQATRTDDGWQTDALTPTPLTPLGTLELQAPVFHSPDLSQTIFTTPQAYAPGDRDEGALDLYLRSSSGSPSWISQGTQGGTAPDEVTYDGATPDAGHVVFSTAEPLLDTATGLNPSLFPEPEYLYDRVSASGTTNLVGVNDSGEAVSSSGAILGNGARLTTGSPPVDEYLPAGTSGTTTDAISGDGSKIFFESPPPGVVEEGQLEPQPVHLYMREDNAHTVPLDNPAAQGSARYEGASADGSLVFFTSNEALGGDTSTGTELYEFNTTSQPIGPAAPMSVRPVSDGSSVVTTLSTEVRHPFEGTLQNGATSERHGEENEVRGASPGDTEVRLGGTGTELSDIEVDQLAPGQELIIGEGSSAETVIVEGHRTGQSDMEWIKLEAPLTKSHAPRERVFYPGVSSIEVASTADFFAGEQITIGQEPLVVAEVVDATHLALTTVLATRYPAGEAVSIGVAGEALGVTAITNDGSHIYYVAKGVLAPNANAHGATATAGQPNLYVFDTASGQTTFIATLDEKDVSSGNSEAGLVAEPDVNRPAVPTPDGTVLAFASSADLTGQNSSGFDEIYRYSTTDNSLVCVSCTPPGTPATGNADFGDTAGGSYDPPGLTSPMSEDGQRIFFDTPDALVPADLNSGAPPSPVFGTPSSTDVYEWENGTVSLLSDGGSAGPSTLSGTTPSGNDVFIVTNANLTPQDVDGGYSNVYDARVGGGFPAPAAGAPTCTGAGCRAAFGAAPVFGTPASNTLTGAGNLPAPAAPVTSKLKPRPKSLSCRRGFTRRRVKSRSVCVRRKARKAGHGARQARGAVVTVNDHRSR
jgi:hypothetical protein